MKLKDLFGKKANKGEFEDRQTRYVGQIKAPLPKSNESQSCLYSERKKLREQYKYKGRITVDQLDKQDKDKVNEKNNRIPIIIERDR